MDLLFEATLTADTRSRGLNRPGTQWLDNDTYGECALTCAGRRYGAVPACERRSPRRDGRRTG